MGNSSARWGKVVVVIPHVGRLERAYVKLYSDIGVKLDSKLRWAFLMPTIPYCARV